MIPVSLAAFAASLSLVALLLGIAAYALRVLWRAARVRPLGLGAPSARAPRLLLPSEIAEAVLAQLPHGGAYVALTDGELRVTPSEWGGWWLQVDNVASHHASAEDLVSAMRERFATRGAVRELRAATAVQRRLP